MKNLCTLTFILATCLSYSSYTPRNSRPERASVISPHIKPNSIGAEIGVAGGSFSYHVLLKKFPKKLYLIDSWDYWPKKKTDFVTIDNRRAAMHKQYEKVRDFFASYNNVTVIKERSDTASKQFAELYFDYVYIDGEHSFEGAYYDLKNYFPKVRVGGLIMGDDWGWTGVGPAVKEFVREYQGRCEFLEVKHGQYVLRKLKK